MEKLGKLENVELRTAWRHEALDFTQWLALEENLLLLSEEVGVDIKLLQTEANVGNFNVDILAEEENTGKKIIIENQLEITNHDHLGKIITYASGHDAKFIIWVVKEVREEHRQAIDWLNNNTGEDINFFAIKMELWKIGDSPSAPKFHIISKPNNWAKIIKKSSSNPELTDTRLRHLEFWDSFNEYTQENSKNIRLRKTYPCHWYDVSIGSSEAHISLTRNTQNKELACEIYINNNKELYDFLETKKQEIEAELGENLEWLKLENKKASRIKLTRSADFNEDNSKNTELFSWLIDKIEKFQGIFSRHIREFR